MTTKTKTKTTILYMLIVILLIASIYQGVQIYRLNKTVDILVTLQQGQTEFNTMISDIVESNIKSMKVIGDGLIKLLK
jgi:hypothetical protein